jgi:hypothetical protein
MADLTTYQFYTGTYYGDSVSEADFPKWLSKATDELHFLTNKNITDEAVVTFSTEIQKAVCALIDVLSKVDALSKAADAGIDEANIKSRTSGGESVTYGSIDSCYKKAVSNTKSLRALEFDVISPYLTGTGLLYWGI